MSAYYNEFDPGAAAWLRELIRRGLIADGEVDDRSILDVRPVDLAGFTQCHFFAGIGGWSYALRLAGWADDRPVWTGSPPCQPFSAAGQQRGKDDERHLAPHFVELVRACRPHVLFGEQVASAQVFGGAAKRAGGAAASAPAWVWIDDLCDRLEAAHYAVGASDIPAAGVGAPHIRQRTFFGAVRLADSASEGLEGTARTFLQERDSRHAGSSDNERLADAASAGHVPGALRSLHRGEEGAGSRDGEPERRGSGCRLADAGSRGSTTWIPEQDEREEGQPREHDDSGDQSVGRQAAPAATRPSPTNGFWRDADWLFCRDGKWRPVEPGTFPLAHGVSARVGRLRGYGNAIVPQVAAEFVGAFVETLGGGET